MKWMLIILSFTAVNFCHAQDTAETIKKWVLNGYIKNVESISFDKNFENSISSNLLHNRLNAKWMPSGKITMVAELRNRLFWGEEVKLTPDFVSLLKNTNEKMDLQRVWIQNKSLVLHTNIERLSVQYHDTSWNAKLGRQRINWGVSTTWKERIETSGDTNM